MRSTIMRGGPGRRSCGMSPQRRQHETARCATDHGSRAQYGTGGSQRRSGLGVTSGSQIGTSDHHPCLQVPARNRCCTHTSRESAACRQAPNRAVVGPPCGSASVRPRAHKSSRLAWGAGGPWRQARWEALGVPGSPASRNLGNRLGRARPVAAVSSHLTGSHQSRVHGTVSLAAS
jgi:hypothetical protein